MKKFVRLTALLLAVAMTLALTACGGSDAGSSGTLTMQIWDTAQRDGMQALADAYHEKNPDITVEIQVTSWDEYWTKLEAAATSNTLPDVFWMHTNYILQYADNGMLADLTDLYSGESATYYTDHFSDVSLSNASGSDGKIYGVPKDKDTVGLVYNKEMFDAAGVAYPDETWTWDDYYEAAVALTKEDGSQYGTAMSPSNNQDGWMNIVYSMGGSVISEDKKSSGFDDPNTIKAMEFVDKLVKDGMPAAAVMAENANDVMLSSGKIAMLPLGSWMVAPLKDNAYVVENCSVAVLPKDAETGRRISIYNGLGWAVSANTENPEAAWQLVEWFGSKDGQTRQAELGVSMSAYEGVSDGWKNSTDAFDLQPYLDMREDIVFRPYSSSTVTWENKITEDLKEAWNGNSTMSDVCAVITQDMNEILAAE